MTAMKSRAALAATVAAALAAAIWALSAPLTGHSEPWDAHALYYPVALALAGVISGAIVPKHLWAHYAGAMLGQIAYELAVLQVGALFFLGLVFLAGYGIIFPLGVALAAYVKGLLHHAAPTG